MTMILRFMLLIILVLFPAFPQGVITTVAGTDFIFPDDGNSTLRARLSTPYGLVFDNQQNLILTDPGLNMVLRVDTNGIVSVLAGNGLARFAGDGGPARAASVSMPWGVASDSTGNIYFADA